MHWFHGFTETTLDVFWETEDKKKLLEVLQLYIHNSRKVVRIDNVY